MEEATHRWPTLIRKYLSGDITPEELSELERLALTSPIKQQQYLEISNVNAFTKKMHDLHYINTDEAWKKIRGSLGYRNEKERTGFKVKRYVLRLFPYATAVLPFVVLMIILLLPSYRAPLVKDHNYAKIEGIEYRLDPGKQFRRYSNGSRFEFRDTVISFVNTANQNSEATGPNKIIVVTTNGRQLKVILPDSSIVRLNTASSITFPLHFGKHDRKVMVFGEAYINVYANKNNPFIVSVKNIDIIARGTAFNISNYENEEIKTTLIEGDVVIKQGKKKFPLKAGQEATADKKNEIAINPIPNVKKTLAWINNQFDFQNATIGEIVTELARWYDLEIDIKGNISNTRYDCQFPRSTDLQDIIRVLNTQNKTQIIMEGKKLIVTNDTTQKNAFSFLN